MCSELTRTGVSIRVQRVAGVTAALVAADSIVADVQTVVRSVLQFTFVCVCRVNSSNPSANMVNNPFSKNTVFNFNNNNARMAVF